MDSPPPPTQPVMPTGAARSAGAALDARIARFQMAVFAWIAVASAVAFAVSDGAVDTAPPRSWTVTAVLLAVGAVSFRQFSTSPVMRGRTRVALGITALALAAGVSLCGVAIAWEGGPRRPALAFAAGAALLALRRPRVDVGTAPTHEER